MRWIVSTMCLTVGILGYGSLANAQDTSLGEFEYQNSCVVCHGASGKGDGPFVAYLSGPAPSDLTVIQKNNGGVFPVTAVYGILEGNNTPGVHGTSDMPIWGNRFRSRIDSAGDANFSPAEAETYVRGRILALIEYLASIQEQ